MDQPLQLFEVAPLVGKGPLGDDPSAVERGVDPVDRHAEDLHAVFERLLDGVRPLEGGQQRGMDVDDPAAVGPQQLVGEDAHVTGQADQIYPELGDRPLGEVLLTPTRIYVKSILRLLQECDIHGISHITGGGFDENIPRILHDGQGIAIDEGSWEILPVFRMLEERGGIAHREMFNIFNMGIGMVVALDASQAERAIAILEECGERASIIGCVTDKEGVTIG